MREGVPELQSRTSLSVPTSVYSFQSTCITAQISRSPCSFCGTSGAKGSLPQYQWFYFNPFTVLKCLWAQKFCTESTSPVIAFLHQGDFHLKVSQDLCHRWGSLDVALLAFGFNKKLDRCCHQAQRSSGRNNEGIRTP